MKTIIKDIPGQGKFIGFSINKLFYLYKDNENNFYYIDPKKYKRIVHLVEHKFKVNVFIFLDKKIKVRRTYCIEYVFTLPDLDDEVIIVNSIYPADLNLLLKDKTGHYTYKYLKQHFSNVIDKKCSKIYLDNYHDEYLGNLVRYVRTDSIVKEIQNDVPNVFPGEEK